MVKLQFKAQGPGDCLTLQNIYDALVVKTNQLESNESADTLAVKKDSQQSEQREQQP